jgi:WD40 repeat protein
MLFTKKSKLLAVGFAPLALAAALLGRSGGTARRADAAGAGPIASLKGHQFPVQALAFAPDGATLTTAAYNLRAPLSGVELGTWDVGTGQPTARHVEHPGGPLALALGPGGQRLAVATQDRVLRLGTAIPPHEWRSCEVRAPVQSLAFSADGYQLALSDWEYDVTLLDAADGRPRTRFKGVTASVFCLAFAPGGAVLAGGDRDGTIHLWDTTTGEEFGSLRGHDRPAMAVAFAPDGKTLASGDLDGTAKLWDVPSRKEKATLATTGDEAAAVAFSLDGRTLATADGRAVRLWDAATGDPVAELVGHEGKVKCLAFSPDGTVLASGGHDRTAHLWRVARPAGP